MHGATIHTEDSCTIVISNGGAQTFHLRATSEVERQKWVTELELAKARQIGHTNPGEYMNDKIIKNVFKFKYFNLYMLLYDIIHSY